MIERATGTIQLLFDNLTICPSLTREQFLASPPACQCRELVRNEAFCSFRLPTSHFEGHSFVCGLQFRGSVLHRVSIQCADPEFGSTWSDWSDDRELARKKVHDSMLRTTLGPDWDRERFMWGAVDSAYDPRGGFSSVGVTYMA